MVFFSVIKVKSKETLNLSSKQVCVGVKTGKGGMCGVNGHLGHPLWV